MSNATASEAKPENRKPPTCVIVLGMAGSGKTTWMQRFNATLHMKRKRPYVMNLDPAVLEVPYPANIDIRDTVKYKEVMKQYSLGPNGGIVTSLNLFATRFDQVLKIVEKRKDEIDYVLIDTPGQIEVFTWSASGSIITETLASTGPTVILYVMAVSKCVSPVTFMSNMMYACSILYKTELPFIIVLNKSDIISHKFALEWMRDYESFLDAVNAEDSYISNLSRSLSLVLDDFYTDLRAVGFSSVTGEGLDELLKTIGEARKEYYEEFLPDLKRKKEKAQARREREAQKQIDKLKQDLTPTASRFSSRSTSKIASRDASPDRFIAPSQIMDNQATGDAGEDTPSFSQSAREKLEEESFQRYIDSRKAQNS